MAHEKNCQNCGKLYTGNINRRFCSDACRKYYKRHGDTSLAGVKSQPETDKSGQERTTPGSGGSSIGNYAAKRGIDLLAKAIANSMDGPKSASSITPTAPVNTPLQMLSAGKSLANPTHDLLLPRVNLSNDFSVFLGKVMYPFKMLVWGLPGSGKSTFCMKFANEIAVQYPLLYIAGEEALNSQTLLDKQRKTLIGQNANRCFFLDRLPQNQIEWNQVLLPAGLLKLPTCQVVFYDSITKLGITPFYVDSAAYDYRLPALAKSFSHVFITHAHKDGKQYRGDGSWGHEVDIVVRVEKGVAVTEKNRFGEVGQSLKIF